ncbi:hypothetical protein I8920_00420 [Curtobacterium sp. YC1]|uniref:hypothetical protein n=1 Tax=Curtobacterium sp. YC1 TaxID=2795488 RepID=UPI0018E515EC|nr:hypothetical protein [Curtobacterium sp. YC1]QQD76283.1 hypothetical protein I8920_00420 [Curtobacterium sp. YC1]
MADRGSKRSKATSAPPPPPKVKPSPNDSHDVVFFRRHADDDPNELAPGMAELESWPKSVRSKVTAVIAAVAGAPPMRFSGGGYWEAMKGDMKGWFEVRVDGPNREHFRLFCLLDYEAVDDNGDPVGKPYLTIIDGRRKAFKTTISAAEYAKVSALGDEYKRRNPRSVV